MTEVISGLSEIEQNYDGFIFDIYGVLHNGETIFPGTKQLMRNLMDQGKKICLVSNTPKRSWQSKDDLKEFFDIDETYYTDIVTGGESAFVGLKPFEGKTCWFAGIPEFGRIAQDSHLKLVSSPEGADFVLNAISGLHAKNKRQLQIHMSEALKKDLPMLCANPDMIVNIGKEQFECGGTYAKYYEEHGGKVSYHGKPHPHVYDMAFNILGTPDKERVCAVGDSFHTDIQGANRYGINSIWNLNGIHWKEVASNDNPDKADERKILNCVEQNIYKPSFVLKNGFRW